MTRRIAFAVGDTAGHVMPALAIAEAYEALAGPVEVRLVAAPGGPAAALATRAGVPLDIVAAAPLARVGIVARLNALVQVAAGIPGARRLLRQSGVRLVVGTGGYASGTVLLAARSLGLATAVVEANVVPGLANRLLKWFVERTYVPSPEAVRHFGARQAVVTGLPVRRAISRLSPPDRAAEPFRQVRVLVTGASRGERFLADEMPEFLAAVQRFGPVLDVRHQCGVADAAVLERRYAAAGVAARVTPFVDEMAGVYAWAQFVVTRAGANTLAELSVAGLPALAIPLSDAAADHHSANAAAHAAAGAALWSREQGWNRDLMARDVAAVLCSPGRWTAMASAARGLARTDAAQRIVEDCEQLMEGRW
jgi:UDP-N-acetylglucosamine--N-acetylmuramyl-(pentapeptide) pyrophosphoryl-undecaprenol N-acetylglucosamine transferase